MTDKPSRAEVEAAAWRIYTYLGEHGDQTGRHIRANANIGNETFAKAVEMLLSIGLIYSPDGSHYDAITGSNSDPFAIMKVFPKVGR